MGKIVVIEGTDFSGKTTQYEMMLERLKEEGRKFGTDSFPNYDEESSYFVRAYLQGKFAENPQDIKPDVASIFYALDRYSSYLLHDWGKIYREGGNVLFVRYITSNVLFQAAKYDDWNDQKNFIDWLYTFETKMLGIPKEDCTIFLDMPIDKIVELKKKRLEEQHGLTSNGSTKDIHEENIEFIRKAHDFALMVSQYLGWKVVSCVDENNNIKTREQIHNEIYEIVDSVFEKD